MTAARPVHIGKYEVLRLLGSGGMGRVYLARDPDIDREVAIKRVSLGTDEQAQARFLREARTMGRLNHPNITTLLEFGMHEGEPFLVLELLSGEDLSQWLQRPHTLREQLQVMLDISRGLEAAHRAGILHRDLKPDNVRVLDDGRCKLLDFGIADAGAEHLTASGYFVGTPEYVAPEVIAGAAHTAAADLYALGLLFYVLFAGDNPLRAETLQATVARVVQRIPPPLAQRVDGVPPALARLIQRCLAKEPGARPGDAGELVATLERCLAEAGPEQRVTATTLDATREVGRGALATTGPRARLLPSGRRHRWLAALAVPLVLAVALGLFLRRAPAPIPEARRTDTSIATPEDPAPPDTGQERTEATVAPATPAAYPAAAGQAPVESAASAIDGGTDAGAVEPQPDAASVGSGPTANGAMPAAAASPRRPSREARTEATRQAPVSAPAAVPSPVDAAPAVSGPADPPASDRDGGGRTADATQPSAADRATTAGSDATDLPVTTPGGPAVPALTATIELQIDDFSPHVLRQGRSAILEVRGRGLAAVTAASVLAGGKVDERFRLGPLEHPDPHTLRFTLSVERSVPLGNYALLLQGPTLRATPLMLRVGL